MTGNDNSPTSINVELGSLIYQTIIAIASVGAGIEMIQRRPDSKPLKEPLTILANLNDRAREAAVEFQDLFFSAHGLAGVTDTPANENLDPYDPNDFSGSDGPDDHN